MTRSLSSQKLSRSTRTDPSRTRTLRNDYERKLVKIMRDYKTGALQAFRDTSRALESPTHTDFGALTDRLDQLGIVAKTDAGPVVDAQMQATVTAGDTYAELQLARGGVDVIGVLGGPVDPEVLTNLRARNLSALRGITDETSKQIVQQLVTGTQQGEGIIKLSTRIAERCDNVGITRARLMARTETMSAFNESAEQRYARHGVKEWQWLTAVDDRTCDECMALNGHRFPVGGGPRQPLHPNCRCTKTPVIEEIP